MLPSWPFSCLNCMLRCCARCCPRAFFPRPIASIAVSPIELDVFCLRSNSPSAKCESGMTPHNERADGDLCWMLRYRTYGTYRTAFDHPVPTVISYRTYDTVVYIIYLFSYSILVDYCTLPTVASAVGYGTRTVLHSECSYCSYSRLLYCTNVHYTVLYG